ncbi:MAG: hypothetical protein KDC98_08580 [Planctomycetes bacterium]|nr:hypothetical protein [Planctomycetota bacterium]
MSEPPPLPPQSAGSRRRSGRRARSGKPSRWRLPIIMVLATVGLIGMIALIAGVAAVYRGLAQDVPVTDADRAVLLTAPAFVEWDEEFEVEPTLEVLTKIRNIDRSFELDYEYDAEDFYLSCSVGVETSVSDAKIAYSMMTTGVMLGSSMQDTEWRERPDLLQWGDSCKAAVMYAEDDTPCGNLFACRKGKRTFLAVWSGLWFDDAESMRELLAPVLRRWEDYAP